MTSKPKSTLWPAEPHTLAKIAILRSYLYVYYTILGTTFVGKPLVYVDGFAGPNQYENHPTGSPSEALRAIEAAVRDAGDAWKAGVVHCVFIEKDKARFKHLQQSLQGRNNFGVQLHFYNGEFATEIEDIRGKLSVRATSPLFAFIDPFGASGVPFSVIGHLLLSASAEVLLNLDADGISRVVYAESTENTLLLNNLFGNSSWGARLSRHTPLNSLSRNVLAYYKERLATIAGIKYQFQTEMRGVHDTLNYFLLFAGQHPRGLIKMKEAMKLVDQNGTYQFSDAAIGQVSLFKFDSTNEQTLKENSYKLLDKFRGTTLPYDSTYDEITAYALNETIFPNAKAMLQFLEAQGLIQVTQKDPDRKRGGFGKSVKEISFTGGAVNGSLF